jgi:hypothetical protein
MPDLLETALGKCRKRLLKWRQVNLLWSHGDLRDLRHTVGLVGSVGGSAASVKSRNYEHDFDSPNRLAATFVLTNVVGRSLAEGVYQERRRVAVAIEPVRVRANSEIIANVRKKIIMIAPAM